MPLEIGLWRVDDEPVRITASPMPLESRLETIIEADPAILGEALLLIGRQIPTAYGKIIDLLGVDAEGTLHVLELKRDRTPREVVAQVLDYGSWVQGLGHDDILAMFEQHHPEEAFEKAFFSKFGASPPEELNVAHRLTIIAGDIDPATSRIVSYLAGFDVAINVAFFRYFVDGDHTYLARTWLIDEATTAAASSARAGRTSSREPWNGQDWYVSFGEESGVRDWDDACRYGFVSAGGGRWYSQTMRALPIGGRVFVNIPGTGYVGVGTVSGAAQPFDDATLTVDGHEQPMKTLDLKGKYRHDIDAEDPDEYIVAVTWQETLPRDEAVWEKGMFANQHSACRLRNKFTIEELSRQFKLEE